MLPKQLSFVATLAGLAIFFSSPLTNASAQGAVNFVNSPSGYSDSSTVDRFVYSDFVGGTKLSGTNWVAQLFYGLAGTPVDSLVPLSAPPSRFYDASVTNRLGVWLGDNRLLPGIPDSTATTLQVRVWDGSLYPGWDAAVATDAMRGSSSAFTYVTPAASEVTPDRYTMYGLRAFALNVPEPSGFAVAVTGLIGLLVLRVPAGATEQECWRRARKLLGSRRNP